MPKKIILILIMGVFIPLVFVLADTPSPSPVSSVTPTPSDVAPTSTPSIASPIPQISSPLPDVSLSPDDIIKFLNTPSILISPHQNGILYVKPNQTIVLSATPLNLSEDIPLNWYVNNTFVSSGKTFSFSSDLKSPATYLISASADLSDDMIYNLKGISQVSSSISVRVVDADLYVFAPESVAYLGTGHKIFPSKNSYFFVNAISFEGKEQFYYNWFLDGNYLRQDSGLNKKYLKVLSGSYSTTKMISLDIKDSSGNIVISKKINVPIR